MGSTYVYNSGEPDNDSDGILKVTAGIFFDGTRNNRRNTEIRKIIQRKGEFKKTTVTDEELNKLKGIYNKYKREEDSFGNDFTNVARKYMCSDKNFYSIYVEGIATIDEKDDAGGGFKYGRGKTGIVSKVRIGCNALAEKIKIHKDNSQENIKTIILTVDIFGFSRGAAAARNFAYNLQMNPYVPRFKMHNSYNAEAILVDHDETEYMEIDSGWLKNKMLPKFGHLGTALLQKGIRRDLVDNMEVKVRFLGIYDTVASYDPSCLLLPSFKKKIKELHLHEIGTPEKAVHFVASDEHRKNFSLTRFSAVELNTGIERNFPGVHSDVGGSYNHDTLSAKEIAALDGVPDPVEGVSGQEYIWLKKAYFEGSLNDLREELIEQGWYNEEQLVLEQHWRLVLAGKRFIYRGYSFIPLHFMCDYAVPLVNECETGLFYDKVLADYALNDGFLDNVKTHLQKHCIEKNENWQLKGNFHHEEIKDTNKVEIDSDEKPANSNLPTADIEEVIITAYKQDFMLRKLRNEYLRRSSRINDLFTKLAHGPRESHRPEEDRKRMEF